MEYGSIFGHGAYLGPDFTADYLRRSAESALRTYGESGDARARVIADFQANRYDPDTKTLPFSAAQAKAFGELERYYAAYFGDPTTGKGLKPEAITNPEEIRQLTSYFAWTSWAASARRRARTTPTRTPGRRSRSSATGRPVTSSSGACCR